MAKKKIDEFSNKATPDSTDLFLLEDISGTYFNVTKTQLATAIGGGGTILGSIDAIAGLIPFGTGVADTVTSDPSFYYSGGILNVPEINGNSQLLLKALAGSVGIYSAAGNSIILQTGTTGTLSLDTETTGPISMGVGAFSKSITIGNVTGSTSVNINSGSASCGWNTNNGRWTLSTGTGNINVGVDAFGKTITLGNVTVATSIGIYVGGTLTLDGAAGSIFNIGASLITGAITIGGTGLHTGAITIGGGTGAQTLNFGTGGTNAKTINIGSPAGGVITIGNTTIAQTIGIATGTGGATVNIHNAANTGSVNVGGNFTTGTITFGSVSQTGAITLGRTAASTGTSTINIGSGVTTSTHVQTINIGVNGVQKLTNLGNTNTTSILTLLAGVGTTNYTNGVFTFGTTFPLINGYNTDYDPICVIARTVDYNTTQNAHSFVDATVFSKLTSGYANNAFTDNGKITNPVGGTGVYNHHCSFQSQFEFRNTGGTTTDYFFMSDYILMTSGSLTNRYGHYFVDAGGTGTVTNQYALYVPTISRGSAINEAIHIVSNDSYFGGKIKMVTTSGSANVVSPEIAFYHATTAKTSFIQDKIITNTSELKFNVSNYNFSGYKEMLTLRGGDTGTTNDYVTINATRTLVGSATSATAKFNITSNGSTSITNALYIENSAPTAILVLKDNGDLDLSGFTIRQGSSYTTFKTSGSNGYLWNNLSDANNLMRLSNTGVLTLNSVAAYDSNVSLSVVSQVSSTTIKQGIAEFYKSTPNKTGFNFYAKEGVGYIQGFTSLNTQTVNLVLGGYDGAGNQLETISLNSNGTISSGLPTANTGLSAGQWYIATAATILANGDKVVGVKQ